MTPQPPTSTPFPTRRSSDLSQLLPCARHGGRHHRGSHARPPRPASPLGVGTAPADLRRGRRRDRKSTRLNSSHTVISYAVFCLKKKKKPMTPIYLTHTTHCV